MKKRERIGTALENCGDWIFGGLFFIILFLLLFAVQNTVYAYKAEFALPNYVYLLLGLVIWVGVRVSEEYWPKAIKEYLKVHSEKFIRILTILFFVFLVYIVYNYYFITGWDAGLLIDTAYQISSGQSFDSSTYESYYFSIYPNNILLIFIFSKIMKLESLFGVLDAWTGIMGILTVQCLISALTGLLVFKTAGLWGNSLRLSWNTWGMYVLIIGVSPWVSIPYSDSMGLIFPVLFLYLYFLSQNGKWIWVKCLCMTATAVLGYKIKPQLTIIAIAAVVIFFLNVLKGKWKIREWKTRAWKAGTGILTGAVIMFLGCHLASSSIPIELDKEEAFGPAHFVMMGLNPETNGGFLEGDVEYTYSQSADKRTQADIEMIRQRLENYGPTGLLEHLKKKLLSNYGDGTWAWGAEGGFYTEILENKNQGMSPFFKSIYYYEGDRYTYFCSYSQMVWLLLLSGGFFAFLFRKKDWGRKGFIIMLSLVGLTLFELIFEARARYLYCYVPLYLLLGSWGLEQCYLFIRCKIKGRMEHGKEEK